MSYKCEINRQIININEGEKISTLGYIRNVYYLEISCPNVV